MEEADSKDVENGDKRMTALDLLEAFADSRPKKMLQKDTVLRYLMQYLNVTSIRTADGTYSME